MWSADELRLHRRRLVFGPNRTPEIILTLAVAWADARVACGMRMRSAPPAEAAGGTGDSEAANRRSGPNIVGAITHCAQDMVSGMFTIVPKWADRLDGAMPVASPNMLC